MKSVTRWTEHGLVGARSLRAPTSANLTEGVRTMITLARRFASTFPVLILSTLIVFLLVQFSPGDPAIQAAGGLEARPADIERIREQMGLNDPWFIQYMRWVGLAVRGDLGQSLHGNFSVTGQILNRLPVTISITVGAVVFALLIALPAGVLAATFSGKKVDRFVTAFATAGLATPNFFLGILLAMVFGRWLGWLPAIGYRSIADAGVLVWLQYILLPSVALGAAVGAEMTRHLRASLRDVLQRDFIRTARAMGLTEKTIVFKHGLKNAAIPLVTVLGLQVRNLLGGTVAVELVFALNGFGDLAVRAVFDRDFPMIQGIVLVSVLIVVAVNLVVDMSYFYFNPKVRSA